MKKLLAILTVFCAFCLIAPNANALLDNTTADATVEDVQSNANVSQTFEASETKRGFAMQPDVSFIGGLSYFGPNNPGNQFMPLKQMLQYRNVFKADWATNMLTKAGKLDVQYRPMNRVDEGATQDRVMISIKKPDLSKCDAIIRGYGTVAAKGSKGISADNLAAIIDLAAKNDANYVHILSEGINTELNASGWGITLGGSLSAVESGSKDNVAGGGFAGTGYAEYKSGYINKPWLQFIVLKLVQDGDGAELMGMEIDIEPFDPAK